MIHAVSLTGYLAQINLLDLLPLLRDRDKARGRNRGGECDREIVS